MRPSILDPLFVPVTSLDGIGPKVSVLVDKVIPADISARQARAGDLLFVLPHGVIDRRSRPGIARAPQGRSSRSTCASTATSHRRAATSPCPTASSPMTRRARSPSPSSISRTEFLEKPCPSASTWSSPARWSGSTAAPRWSIPTHSREPRTRASCRWWSRSTRSPPVFSESAAPGDRAGARPCAGPAEWQDPGTDASPELSSFAKR